MPLLPILDDFNEDGHLDIAVTLTFNKMQIFLGRGDGTFKNGATYQTGSRSFSGVSTDFNGDGHTDIVLAAHSSNASSIRIYAGLGDGTFLMINKIAQGLNALAIIKKRYERRWPGGPGGGRC